MARKGDMLYTSPSGTEYTQVNDSVYDWYNNGSYGRIELRPNSGGPIGWYYVNRGSAGPDAKKQFSPEYLSRHLANIEQGKKENGFKPYQGLWADLKDIGRTVISSIIGKKGNGGSINYLDMFRK